MRLTILVFILLNLLDYASTLCICAIGGVEYNPIIAAVGTDHLLVYKVAISALVIGVAHRWPRVIKGLNIGLAFVVAGNFAAIAFAANEGLKLRMPFW